MRGYSLSGSSTLPRVLPVRATRPVVAGDAMSAAFAVLRAAARLEPDPGRAVAWYRDVPIAELGSRTANELVALGQGDAVTAFLGAIADGRRG
jgi:hypothetical protein